MTPYLLHHLFDVSANGDHACLVEEGRSLSHSDVFHRSRAVAKALDEAGLKPGDRCCVYLERGFQEVWAIFGTSMAQGVFVPINALLKKAQVQHIVEDCEPSVFLTSRDKLAASGLSPDSLSSTRLVFIEDLTDDTHAFNVNDVRLGEDLAAILYTSGSTGRPKGVMVSHRNLLAGSRIVSQYLNLTKEDRLASLLPFSFDYGLNQLITVIEQGASLAFFSFRFGEDIAKAINGLKITGLAGVPTVWAILCASAPSLKTAPPPTLRFITNSGGAVPTDTVKRLRSLLPKTDIFLMYGLTEAFRSTFLSPDEVDTRPTSIGKAIPESEMLVVTDDGREAGPGETGMLVHRGPTVSMGYWRRPDATAQVLRPNPLKAPDTGVDIVCYSGDLVRRDAEGFLYFVGRNDAMIKSAGYRISPSEVEDALMALEAFDEVAIIGLPDPTLGQKVHAVAVARAGTKPDVRALLGRLNDVLPAYMVPRQIELVGALPRTPNGKVDVKGLKEARTAASSRAT